MKKLFIIANWKSNKTQLEAIDWLEFFQEKISDLVLTTSDKEKEAIVCPSFTLLSEMSFFIEENKLPIKIGSQDVSPFSMGAYTGAINAQQVKEFGTYAIIGHSERRRYFNETDDTLAKKAQLAEEASITPIYCVQGQDDAVPPDVILVAYEPVAAIGSGHPDTPESANTVAESIKARNPHVQYVLYGGSVTPDNVLNFTNQSSISGVLVGGASLHAETFFQLINNA